jgi:hypothetical protein
VPSLGFAATRRYILEKQLARTDEYRTRNSEDKK